MMGQCGFLWEENFLDSKGRFREQLKVDGFPSGAVALGSPQI